ncbi:B-cell lymphoma/leukemia 10 isoform X2 [Engystomops pustulosus]
MILNIDDTEEIMCQTTSKKKAGEMLDRLAKNPKGLDALIESIRQQRTQDFLIDKILDEVLRVKNSRLESLKDCYSDTSLASSNGTSEEKLVSPQTESTVLYHPAEESSLPNYLSNSLTLRSSSTQDNDKFPKPGELGAPPLPSIPSKEPEESCVLLASDPASEELLAVKVMMKSSEVEHDIQTELEVLKIGTGCRFLTSLRAYKETHENYIIVMDYMAGGDLHDLITEWMPFDMQTTSDLKPLNILRDANGHIKIADFGLSAVNVFKGERTRGIVGTRGYIAPEVMEGELYNHLVDSFSLGVILFMMSVGDQPYYGQGSMQDYYWSLREDVPVFMPGMCPHAISFIEGLLCKSPCDRLAITSSIRSHPFFHSTDWGAVESGNAHPPFHGDF